MNKNTLKRSLASVLAVLMLLSTLTLPVFAGGGGYLKSFSMKTLKAPMV